MFAIALGDEDVNDHEVLRDDLVLQTACGGDRRLASPSTVGRLERAADRSWAWAAHETLVESFIASYDEAPEELVLDFDCTDDAVHGCQEGRFFHGYYDHYCFLPLYVFCGDQLLVSYLRPSNIDQAKHAWAILALLVKRLRQAWPAVRLTVRADSGFCRHKMLSWCERHEVGYIVGLAKNARINDQAARGMALAAAAYERTGEKQRVFADLSYGARSWNKERRVIARLEHGPKGANPRYVITQPRRRGEDALRAPLLRPRRDGEPHQGAAAGPLRRPHQLPQVVAQPVPSDPLIARLYADRDDPPAGAEGHHDGPGSGGHYPPQAPEDRRRRHTQHPPRPPPSLQRLPVPGPGPSHGSQAQAGITDPFPYPTQTHKRRRRLPARAPLAQNRPKQAKTGNGTDNHQPESPASLKSANRKTRDPTFGVQKPYFRTLRDESGLDQFDVSSGKLSRRYESRCNK